MNDSIRRDGTDAAAAAVVNDVAVAAAAAVNGDVSLSLVLRETIFSRQNFVRILMGIGGRVNGLRLWPCFGCQNDDPGRCLLDVGSHQRAVKQMLKITICD